jgi:hypothetical protein
LEDIEVKRLEVGGGGFEMKFEMGGWRVGRSSSRRGGRSRLLQQQQQQQQQQLLLQLLLLLTLTATFARAEDALLARLRRPELPVEVEEERAAR